MQEHEDQRSLGRSITAPRSGAAHIKYTNISQFKQLVEIYAGSISNVYKGVCAVTGARVVVKIYHKAKMTPKQVSRVSLAMCTGAIAIVLCRESTLASIASRAPQAACAPLSQPLCTLSRTARSLKAPQNARHQDASKCAAPSPQVHKLGRELDIQQRVRDCPFVCQLLAHFEDASEVYLVLESCDGGDLFKTMMKAGGRLPEATVCVDIVLPLLRVLESLHTLSIIHRDIKPENIFLTGDGAMRLGDFGLAIDATTEIPFCRSGAHARLRAQIRGACECTASMHACATWACVLLQQLCWAWGGWRAHEQAAAPTASKPWPRKHRHVVPSFMLHHLCVQSTMPWYLALSGCQRRATQARLALMSMLVLIQVGL